MQLEKNKTQSAKIFISLVILLLLLGVVGAIYQTTQQEKDSNEVTIRDYFENKIVYTMNVNADTSKFKKDCRQRGGEFNSCGTICAPDAKVCGEVCAYTCDLSNADDNRDEKAEPPSDWQTYTNSEFDFSIKLPPEWRAEVNENDIVKVVHLLPPENQIEDLFKRTGITHVSIYPQGLPTEGIFGERTNSNISPGENTKKAEDFLLTDGTRWASTFTFQNPPESWEDYGFIWAGVNIKNSETGCLNQEGEELGRQECDPMTNPHRITWSGSINEDMREIEKKILKTFKFTEANNESPQNDQSGQDGDENGVNIKINQPSSGDEVESPLVIKGEARGSWYFEGSFTAALKDANGNEIARSPVQAQGEWMTEDFVLFEATMNFEEPETEQGVLFLEKANPSGRPQNAEMRAIPIKFK